MLEIVKNYPLETIAGNYYIRRVSSGNDWCFLKIQDNFLNF